MEPELNELMAAVDAYGATKQAFGQSWKPNGEGGELHQRYKDRLEPDKAAVEREAAAFAMRLLENATAPLFIRYRTREAQRKAIADHLLTELDRWRKVLTVSGGAGMKIVAVQVTLETTFDFDAEYEDGQEIEPESAAQQAAVKAQVVKWLRDEYGGFFFDFHPDVYVNIIGVKA